MNKTLFIAFVTIFLDLLGFGIIIPIQAFYAESFNATPKVITLLGASYSLMQFFFAPFWGKLSDRMGRRPIILFSVLISAAGHFIFAAANGLALLFAARMLAGFGNANIGTAQAIIADVTTKENRAKGMGLIGAAFGLGFIFGPAIGAILGQHHPTTPLYAAGVLALLNFVFAYFMLPETKTTDSAPIAREVLPLKLFKHAKQYINVNNLLWISLLYTIGFALMEQAIALFIEHTWVIADPLNNTHELDSSARIGEASKLTGIFLVSIGFTAAVVQGGLIGKLNKAFGELKLIKAGLFIVVVSFLLIPLAGQNEYWTLVVIGPIMAVGAGILNPSRSSLLSISIPDSEQGSILGLNQSFSALGRFIGPSCAGVIYEVNMNYPFVTGAALLLLCLYLTKDLSSVQTSSPINKQDSAK